LPFWKKPPLPLPGALLLLALTFSLPLALALTGCGGDGGGNEDAEIVIERFLGLGQDPGSTIDVMLDGVPSDLPSGLPEYPGSSLLGSTVSENQGQKGYTVLRETSDTPDQVLLFYEEALEKDPWQIVLSTSVEGFAALQFTKIDDANLLGGVIVQGADDGRTAVLVSVQTVDEQAGAAEPYEPGASKPLPRGFPAEIPLYPDMIVTETAWARSPGVMDFQVTFITKDPSNDVLDFYRNELSSRGWTVTDETGEGGTTALSFESAALGGTWSGSLMANVFDKEPSYTQARLLLRIAAEEQPSSTLTPAP
jgi:hypothetical protein